MTSVHRFVMTWSGVRAYLMSHHTSTRIGGSGKWDTDGTRVAQYMIEPLAAVSDRYDMRVTLEHREATAP